MKTRMIAIASIDQGDRIRKDLGDLDELASSMKRLGLLQPIVLNSSEALVAGGRRLAAAKLLGWKEIPAVVATNLDSAIEALIAERDENTCRKPLTPSEMVEVGRRIEAIERPKAAERKAATQAKPGNDGKSPTGGANLAPPENTGKTRDKVADSIGTSPETYRKAKQVVEAAEQSPSLFGDLPEKMDGESVNAAHKELKRRQSNEESKKPEDANEPSVNPRAAELISIVNGLCAAIDKVKSGVGPASQHPFGRHIHAESVTLQLEAARKALWQSRPTEACNCIRDGKPQPNCKACFGSGLCPASRVLRGGR